MMLDALRRNLESVNQRISAAAEKSGRSRRDIKLVAVTKYVDAETTQALVDAGQNILGESRPQVLWSKAEELEASGIEWHLIGHLQRNKVARTVPLCSLVHSVDSLRLLQTINKVSLDADFVCDCLLEINISNEPSKHGLRPDEVEQLLTVAATLPGIRVHGFMGMASLAGNENVNRQEFAELRELADRHKNFQSDNVEIRELSMGMSGDFEAAIEEGATIVRIGSTLFEGV